MHSFPLPSFLTQPLQSAARTLDLAKGETLFRMGSPVESIYFIQRGRIKAVRSNDQGNQALMLQAVDGEFFAESTIGSECYICDAFATEKSLIAALPASLLREELRSGGEFAYHFALAMAANARRQCSRYERIRIKRARDRVLHLLLCEGNREGCFTLQSNLAELAEELALEPETLYRVLRDLSDQGVIQRSPGHITLL